MFAHAVGRVFYQVRQTWFKFDPFLRYTFAAKLRRKCLQSYVRSDIAVAISVFYAHWKRNNHPCIDWKNQATTEKEAFLSTEVLFKQNFYRKIETAFCRSPRIC